MLCYLSFVTALERAEFLAWGASHLSIQQAEFQERFRPVFEGLLAAAEGRTPAGTDANDSGGRQFLGWSTSRHWLLG